MTIEEDISKFTHDFEEKFQEVKEHMILTVERHSLVIAFVLMSITTVILIAGTVYVWIFHHHGNKYDDEPEEELTEGNEDKRDDKKGGSRKDDEGQGDDKDIDDLGNIGTKETQQVRKRTTSRSNSINNNDSPVKSKIPVRAKTKAS